MEQNLDDRIYALQKTKSLPIELKNLVRDADIAFLQNRIHIASEIIMYVERKCRDDGIEIYDPNSL